MNALLWQGIALISAVLFGAVIILMVLLSIATTYVNVKMTCIWSQYQRFLSDFGPTVAALQEAYKDGGPKGEMVDRLDRDINSLAQRAAELEKSDQPSKEERKRLFDDMNRVRAEFNRASQQKNEDMRFMEAAKADMERLDNATRKIKWLLHFVEIIANVTLLGFGRQRGAQ